MFILVIILILGVASAIFATQNSQVASLNFGDYGIQAPLYLVVLVSIGVGLLIAFLIHIVKDLSAHLTFNEYKHRVRNLKEEIAALTKANHKLEIENTKLKTKSGNEEFDEDSM